MGLRSGVLFGHNAVETAATARVLADWLREGGQPADALDQAIEILEGAAGAKAASPVGKPPAKSLETKPAAKSPVKLPAARNPVEPPDAGEGGSDQGEADQNSEQQRVPTEPGDSDKEGE